MRKVVQKGKKNHVYRAYVVNIWIGPYEAGGFLIKCGMFSNAIDCAKHKY